MEEGGLPHSSATTEFDCEEMIMEAPAQVGRLLLDMALSIGGQVGRRVGRLVTGAEVNGGKRGVYDQLVCPASEGRLAAVEVVLPGVMALSSPARLVTVSQLLWLLCVSGLL